MFLMEILTNANWSANCTFLWPIMIGQYSVVAVRFFQKKRVQLIDLPKVEDLNERTWERQNVSSYSIDRRIDIKSALQKMSNVRYRMVIEEMDLCDVQPEQLAKEMNITVDNLYNIRRRAHLQLRLVMGRKEEYI